MNIAYVIFLYHPEAVGFVNKDPDLDTFFWELLQFIIERLKPLEKEIDKEENGGDDKGTIICILRNDDKFILFGGYSDTLTEKMKQSFSQKDMEYIMQKIQMINHARNN